MRNGEPTVTAGVSREPLPPSEPPGEVETLLAEIDTLERWARHWKGQRDRAERCHHRIAALLTAARSKLAARVDRR